nr:IclR family transcriptional regulator C-terminal domain-containing protein [uncultured Achromobacter sp.]
MSRWEPKVKMIDALARGLAVLDEVRATQGASLHELHVRTGFAKATLLRILATLQSRGLIWRRLADDHFCPAGAPDARGRQSQVLDRLGQCAAPELDRLQAEVLWPSDLAVRRASAMIVRETNRNQSYFTIRRDNIGFRINMLRSAVGRAYLAFCAEKERESVLAALRRSRREGDALAHDSRAVAAMLDRTRRQGYGLREQRFGGDYDKPRRDQNDRLEALAVPIVAPSGRVYGCVNVVWIQGVRSVDQMVEQCLDPLRRAAQAISAGMGGR